MNYKFLGNVIISGTIRCETALHIGGMVEGYEIGGMDNPIIRDPVSGYPYIPGSSIKGKMRSLLEWSKGLVQVVTASNENKESTVGKVHSCEDASCPVCRSFGAPAEQARAVGPTRLLIRDAHPTEETRKMLDRLQAEKGLPKAEWKSENYLNRITAKGTPRTIERVPQGSEFTLEMVYGLFQVDEEQDIADLDHLRYVFEAMRLLEDSALGGYGSRGSGKVSFNLGGGVLLRTTADYEKGTSGTTISFGFLRDTNISTLKDAIKKKLQEANESADAAS
ncbi:MAG: type III-A CRISPR-associated RAMP protein Csm3 [candidate division WOR-3 bacterium]